MLWAFPFYISICITVKKQGIQEKMKEELTIRKLETIILAEADVKWVDKHEIWVNNRMFDISQKKLENGIYIFTGLYDDDETELVKKEKKSGESENNLLLALFFNCMQHVFFQPLEYEDNVFFYHRLIYIKNDQPACPAFKEISTPPPKSTFTA